MDKCPFCDTKLVKSYNLKTQSTTYKCYECNKEIDNLGNVKDKQYEIPKELYLLRALKH